MKRILPLFFLAFIIGVIVLSKSSSQENKKNRYEFKDDMSLYCAFLKELDFVGEISSIKKSFSSGQPDLIEINCSILNYPDTVLKNKYFKKINNLDLSIRVPRTYTRLNDNDNRLVDGDILKSSKGDSKIFMVTPSKQKIEIDILENKYEYKCQ